MVPLSLCVVPLSLCPCIASQLKGVARKSRTQGSPARLFSQLFLSVEAYGGCCGAQQAAGLVSALVSGSLGVGKALVHRVPVSLAGALTLLLQPCTAAVAALVGTCVRV